MSYYEALEDGIPYQKLRNGMTAYYPPCKYCGMPIKSWSYLRTVTYACPICRKIAAKEAALDKQAGIR